MRHVGIANVLVRCSKRRPNLSTSRTRSPAGTSPSLMSTCQTQTRLGTRCTIGTCQNTIPSVAVRVSKLMGKRVTRSTWMPCGALCWPSCPFVPYSSYLRHLLIFCLLLEVGDCVDTHLRVHGVRNLRVVDASVFPNHVSGNIVGSVVSICTG